MIALGATEISNVCLGSDELNKVCLGSNELWSAEPPLPYDAEVEWIYMPLGSFVNTGVTGINLSSFDIECVIKADGYPSTASSFLGVYGNETRGKHTGGIMIRQYPEGTLNGFIGNYEASGDTTRSIALPSDFFTARLTPTAFYLDGTRVGNAITPYSTSLPNNPDLALHINCRKDYRNTSSGLINETTTLCAAWYKSLVCIIVIKG